METESNRTYFRMTGLPYEGGRCDMRAWGLGSDWYVLFENYEGKSIVNAAESVITMALEGPLRFVLSDPRFFEWSSEEDLTEMVVVDGRVEFQHMPRTELEALIGGDLANKEI